MNKRTLLSILAMALILSLLACGGPAATEAPTGGDDPAPPAEEEKIELRLWMHQNSAFIAANEEIIRRFEAENPNVTIKLETFEYELFLQTLQTSMPAGTEADIMELFGTWVCSYSDRLAEMPESIMSYSQAKDQFFAAPLDGYYCDGKLYGLPNEFNIENGAVMINKAMFDEAGLAFPPEWGSTEEMLADAQKLVQMDGDTMTVSGYQFIAGDGLAFQFMAGILQRGGEFWKPNNAGMQFDTPEARATLEDMKSWLDAGVTDPYLFNDDSNWVGDAFFSQQTAMGFIGPWIVPWSMADYPELEFGYVPLPNYAGENHYFAADAGWGKVVSPNSEHKDIAFEFVEFAAANAENAKAWNIATGTIPALKSVAKDPTLLDEAPWFEASLQVLEYGRYVGPLPDRDLFWYDIIYPHILGMLQDVETIDEALQAIDAESNAMFD